METSMNLPTTRQLRLLSQLFTLYLTYAARDHFPLKFFLFRALFLLLFSCSALPTSIIGAMDECFVGPIMDKIINACSDYLEEQVGWQTGMKEELNYLEEQVGWQTGMKEELKRLRENYPKIQAVVFAANQAQISGQNPALNKWIWQLRDAIDEADDVLDELKYMKHEQELTKNTEETKLTVRCMMKSMKKRLVKIGERGLERDPNLKRLKEAVQKLDPNLKRLTEAVQKLDKVSTTGVDKFFYLVKDAKQELENQQLELQGAREMLSLPINDLIGRCKAKKSVMEWLWMPSNEPRGTDFYRNISLLSIVGHGGVGKTTLLQHVYNDEITYAFDHKIWVCVSNHFDVKKVIADMLESLEKVRPRLDTLMALHDSLQVAVKSRKFLLVLDDVWEEDEEKDKIKWEYVLRALAYGRLGSKILVTTRTDSVALMFAKVIKKKEEIVKLEGLEEDACMQLLCSHAFAGVENPDAHKNLAVIARDIVKKLSSSPLAAKVIGGVLNDNLDERHWRTVLESNLLDHKCINSTLRLSYIALPNPLKSCFAFCGMFAQNHLFFKDDLVRMWIALGFIQPSQGMTMENIGGRYFDVLVKNSFFDKFELGCDNSSYYKMHDLLHEFAQSVSMQECLRIENSTKLPSIIPETLRHLSIQTTDLDILRRIGKFKHLHSLFLSYEDSNEDSNQDICNALIEIFQASRSLRLLYICTDGLEMILEEIRYLIHLRYLKIEKDNLIMPPRLLHNLCHLQYIIHDGRHCFIHSKGDDFLPSDINNLRCLELTNDCISSIFGIGKLKFFQELHRFYLRDVSGYRIGELENMNDLRILGIYNLENVKDAEEACSAKLCAKKWLTDLTLCWSNTDSTNNGILDENVLDNLQPEKCLRNLSIWNYMGARSAIWMNNVDMIFNLEKIKLANCLEWETLPPFGQLRFLKSLELSNMPKVKWLESKFNGNDKYRAFPLLEVLHVTKLKALEDWFEAGVAAEDGCLFPCLIELELFKCPKLKELPSLPPKLKSLRIEKTGWTTLNFCSNSDHIPLETLKVFICPNIISLPLADEIARLAALRYLAIKNCPNLTSLGRYREVETTNNCHLILNYLVISDPSVLLMEPLRSIAFLKMLSIMENDKLVSFPNEAEQWLLRVRSSLSKLEFANLKSLQSFPSSLDSLSSLEKLSFRAVLKLRELPNLPPSLKRLSIWGCHPELKERYRKIVGSDWNKIAHIPRIHIS